LDESIGTSGLEKDPRVRKKEVVIATLK